MAFGLPFDAGARGALIVVIDRPSLRGFYIIMATHFNFTEKRRNDVKVKDEKYEAEKILNIRKKNGRIKYLVK